MHIQIINYTILAWLLDHSKAVTEARFFDRRHPERQQQLKPLHGFAKAMPKATKLPSPLAKGR
jgi:hypothetical protein